MPIKFTITKLLPYVFIYIGLFAAAAALNYILHLAGLKIVLRYIGIAGTVSIILSFIYSLRKRKIIKSGKPKNLLMLHEILAWLGALMILAHAGIDLDAVIPRIAEFTLMVVVASGITGKYLLRDAKESLKQRKTELKAKGLTEEEIEKELFLLSTIARKMQMWRSVHIPLTISFAAMALLHIIVTVLFWRW